MGAKACSAKENTVEVTQDTETREEFNAASPQFNAMASPEFKAAQKEDETGSQSPPPADENEQRRPSGVGSQVPRKSLADYLGDQEVMDLDQFNKWQDERNLVVWQHDAPSNAQP